ncbi:MAG: RNA polymerase sigma-70 factor [Bacteroidales bacterium]|nr:RNA polymerase sigma-70 factor [Bacteroidales bacterium]
MQQSLISRLKSGDREVFNELCRSRYVSLLAYARIFLAGAGRGWAEDIVQDVLFGLWQNRRTLRDDEGELQAYLLRGVYNRCMNYVNRARRAKQYGDYYEARIVSMMADCWSPDSNPVIRSVFDTDLRDIISEALGKLSPRCREVFTLSYIDNLSNREISERLGISLSTVENHMYLALRQLRNQLAGV